MIAHSSRPSGMASVEMIKTWGWVKKMPDLMREFFFELVEQGKPVAYAREWAKEKYQEVINLR